MEEAREEETDEDEETEPPVIGLGSTATAAEVSAAHKKMTVGTLLQMTFLRMTMKRYL